jgi:hypothetical protein
MGQWVQPASRGELPRREAMQTPEETLSDMLELRPPGRTPPNAYRRTTARRRSVR